MQSLVSIKFSLNEDVRRIKVSERISYPDLLSLLKTLFKLPDNEWENLSLKYTDNENDKCSVTGEQELREAFHAKKDEVLKLELSFLPKKTELQQSPFVNALKRRIQQEQVLQQPQPEARRCVWPERVHQRRATIFGLTEEGIVLMDAQSRIVAMSFCEPRSW